MSKPRLGTVRLIEVRLKKKRVWFTDDVIRSFELKEKQEAGKTREQLRRESEERMKKRLRERTLDKIYRENQYRIASVEKDLRRKEVQNELEADFRRRQELLNSWMIEKQTVTVHLLARLDGHKFLSVYPGVYAAYSPNMFKYTYEEISKIRGEWICYICPIDLAKTLAFAYPEFFRVVDSHR